MTRLEKLMLFCDDEIEKGVKEHEYTKIEKIDFLIGFVSVIILAVVEIILLLLTYVF